MSLLNLIEADQRELDQSPDGNTTVEVGVLPGLHHPEDVYQCPGESHPISRSVHLARLASGFTGCGTCSHRHAQGALPCSSVVESMHEHQCGRKSLVTADGIRGVYLNELGRTQAADWSAAFASLLWDDQPRFARAVSTAPGLPGSSIGGIEWNTGAAGKAVLESPGAQAPVLAVQPASPTRRGPTVVIGFDERPSSPDIAVGTALGLRRMGCHVIDLGQTTNPCFHFAIHHLDASAGIFVTGSGCDPSWTGFNLAGRHALPWSDRLLLENLESHASGRVVRPTRSAGSQRSFHATAPYEAGLWKLFHALRPLQVICGVSTLRLARTLESLFTRLPCGLTVERLPVRRRNLDDPQDMDVRRIASCVVAGRKHLGLIVDDDGERCACVTEAGQLVSATELASLLIDLEVQEHRPARILMDGVMSASLANWLIPRGKSIELERATSSRLAASMMASDANLGFSDEHRIWFRGAYAVCDAILVLARVLQSLSLSDAPMSDVLARIAAL